MEQTCLALHTIRLFNNTHFFDADTETLFDSQNYSMFKYGSSTVACQYGELLAARFIRDFPCWFEGERDDISSNNVFLELLHQKGRRNRKISHDIENNSSITSSPRCPLANNNNHSNKIYITCSPFKVAPTAAYTVAAYFTEYINEYLLSRRLPKATFFKIDRLNVFPDDYGKLSMEQRKEVMSRNPLQLPDGIDLFHSSIIFIDDIRITGAHEKAVQELLAAYHPRRYCKAYVARFEQDKAHENARLESDLNHALVKNLEDLNVLIRGMGNKYVLNARVCKFLLGHKDLTSLEHFLAKQSTELLQKMHDYMVADGYSEMPPFKLQFELLIRILLRRENTLTSQSSFALIGMGLRMIGAAGGVNKRPLSGTPSTYDIAKRRSLEKPVRVEI